MTVVEMLGQLGRLLNDPNEQRYTAFEKLARLNMAQQEIASGVQPSDLDNLAVYRYKLPRNDSDFHFLPLDFLRLISPESVTGDLTGAMRILSSAVAPAFPYDGSKLEPKVRISGGKIYSFGRKFDQDVFISYFRFPQNMRVTGVGDMYKLSSGTIVAGPSWVGPNIESELPPVYHPAIVNRAFQMILVSDSEIKEVPTQT